MKPHAFIFIGRSGCGKGTQVELLKPFLTEKTKLPIFYVETGTAFRQFILGEGYSEKLSHEAYERADRQSDFLACYMWSKLLIEGFDGKSHVIFDGVARSLNEARLLGTALTFYSFEKVHIIYLDVSRGWSEKHLRSRGRADDKREGDIEKRLDWFDQDVMPAVDYLKNSSYHFVSINGERPIPEVSADILNSLTPFFA
jgi:adenylate kinase family enzyme